MEELVKDLLHVTWLWRSMGYLLVIEKPHHHTKYRVHNLNVMHGYVMRSLKKGARRLHATRGSGGSWPAVLSRFSLCTHCSSEPQGCHSDITLTIGGMTWLCYQLGLVGQPQAPQEPPGSLVSISPTQSRDMNWGLLGNTKIFLIISCIFFPGFTHFHSSLPSGKWKFSSPLFNGARNHSIPSLCSWIICVIVLNIIRQMGADVFYLW